jgi:hypothetical protein
MIGIVLGLGWLSIDSRRRAERQQLEQADAAASPEAATAKAVEPPAADRRSRRKR